MRKLLLSSLIVLLLTGAAGAADLSKEPIIRNRKIFRGGRHAISPVIGATVLDHYRQHTLLGAAYTYYIFDWLGVGAEGLYAIGINTSLTEDIEDDYARQGEPLTVANSSLQLLANAMVHVVPFAGKATLLRRWVFYYDFHVVGGVGFAQTKGRGAIEDGAGFSPMFGGGARVFVTPGIAISLDFRDYLVSMVEAGSKAGLEKSPDYRNNLAFTLSVDFLLPNELTTTKR